MKKIKLFALGLSLVAFGSLVSCTDGGNVTDNDSTVVSEDTTVVEEVVIETPDTNAVVEEDSTAVDSTVN